MIEVMKPVQARTAAAFSRPDMGGALEYVVSDATGRLIRRYTDALQKQPTPSSFEAADGRKTLNAKVFDDLAAAKVLTSQVAMHLDREWRDSLFRQLDSLHDVNEWETGDEPIQRSSFSTFLKAILALRPVRRPGLGLSHSGELIAAWTNGRDRLTIEFLPNDRVRWVLTRWLDEEPERFAGETAVSRLEEGLAPQHPEHWFN